MFEYCDYIVLLCEHIVRYAVCTTYYFDRVDLKVLGVLPSRVMRLPRWRSSSVRGICGQTGGSGVTTIVRSRF